MDGGILANKDLKIVAEAWPPFLWTHNCPNDTTEISDWETGCANGEDKRYSGILWKLLLFMQQAKNLSYTMVESSDYDAWGGTCYDANNCTGMVGMERHS